MLLPHYRQGDHTGKYQYGPSAEKDSVLLEGME
jgi:hypothetical protein